ncbi:hypothetical protein BYT27DRAFT_7214030 [Phlegmacium glaucopus]|nr:hypothetical protein BYT27DRAFT_7214030 [Phlegmacium glaucopus]
MAPSIPYNTVKVSFFLIDIFQFHRMGLQLAHIFNNFVVALFFQTPEQQVEGLFGPSESEFLVKRKHKDCGRNLGHPYLARMMSLTGEKHIISVAFPNSAISSAFSSSSNPVVVESLHPLHTGECSQRWTVAVKGDFYTLYIEPRSWDIVEVDAEKGYYKLQMANVGTVASLPSGDNNTQVLVANYLGQKEQWMLQEYPPSSDGDLSNVAGPAAPRCPGYRQA